MCFRREPARGDECYNVIIITGTVGAASPPRHVHKTVPMYAAVGTQLWTTRPPPPLASVLRALLLLLMLSRQARSEVLTPPYFNLAEGRRITATATCGEGTQGPELYCKLVGANSERNVDYEGNLVIQGQVSDRAMWGWGGGWEEGWVGSVLRRQLQSRATRKGDPVGFGAGFTDPGEEAPIGLGPAIRKKINPLRQKL